MIEKIIEAKPLWHQSHLLPHHLHQNQNKHKLLKVHHNPVLIKNLVN
jgi:hypothetical protein